MAAGRKAVLHSSGAGLYLSSRPRGQATSLGGENWQTFQESYYVIEQESKRGFEERII